MSSKIAPSILSADFACLADQVRAVERAGADQIHVDVMDGHFVPNLSMGPVVVRALRQVTDIPLDVHLMITDPDSFLESFVEAGATHISVHVEARGDHRSMFEWLRERNVGRGIALNPETPVEKVLDFVPIVDMVLVMTVHPGFGGQVFLPDNLQKVRKIREREAALQDGGRSDLNIDVEVDGGVDEKTIVDCFNAGANVFVAGSAIFQAPDPAAAATSLRQRINGTKNREA